MEGHLQDFFISSRLSKNIHGRVSDCLKLKTNLLKPVVTMNCYFVGMMYAVFRAGDTTNITAIGSY